MKIGWQDTGIIGFWDAATEYVDTIPHRGPNGEASQASLLTKSQTGFEVRRAGKYEHYLECNPDIEQEEVYRYWEWNGRPRPSVQNQVSFCIVRSEFHTHAG